MWVVGFTGCGVVVVASGVVLLLVFPGVVDGRVNTLHPTPYTLHHTTNTLRPTPYTLHHATFNLHPTPHTAGWWCTGSGVVVVISGVVLLLVSALLRGSGLEFGFQGLGFEI